MGDRLGHPFRGNQYGTTTGVRGDWKESRPLAKGDTGDLRASEILESARSHEDSMRDVLSGRGTRTRGPLHVWKLEDGRFLLVDGHHRFAAGVAKGRRNFKVKVVGEGYTDYWAAPRSDDVLEVRG